MVAPPTERERDIYRLIYLLIHTHLPLSLYKMYIHIQYTHKFVSKDGFHYSQGTALYAIRSTFAGSSWQDAGAEMCDGCPPLSDTGPCMCKRR